MLYLFSSWIAEKTTETFSILLMCPLLRQKPTVLSKLSTNNQNLTKLTKNNPMN